MHEENKLTPKQAAFVREYLVDLNATQAAIRAGYKTKRPDEQGSENLRKPEIAKAIAEAQAERAEKTARTALDVLKDIQAVTIEARNGGDLKTALKGLELEGKHLGMFVERVHLYDGDLANEIEEARKREAAATKTRVDRYAGNS